MQRPQADEHAPYYATYVDRVPDGEILDLLETEAQTTLTLLRSIPEDRGPFRYDHDKWSLNELLGHLVDSERTFGYRAVCFARKTTGELPDFDQNLVAQASNAHQRPLSDLVAEFDAVRTSNLHFFRSLSPEMWGFRGRASGCEFTVRALAYILVGHEVHHRSVLRERYLGDS